MASVVDLDAALDRVDEFWSPHLVGTVNDTALKVVKLNGRFPRHMHQYEDECFLVLEGTLCMDMDGTTHRIGPGEFLVVPKATEHEPHCEGTVKLLLIEPTSTVQQGDADASAVQEARASVRT